MNATEARQRSANAALNLEVERQLEEVLNRAREAADAGLYRVNAGGRLHSHATTRLLALGYEVSYNATTCDHTISWALAKGEPTSSDAKTPAALAKTLDRSHLAKLHDSALFLGEPACSSFRDLIASHLAVLDQLDLHKKYVIRRTTLAPATWADGAPRKSEPSEIYYDWWVGGVCFANLLTPQCTRLTFEQARSLAGYMNRYKGPGQQTFDVCLAEPIEFALDGTVTGGAS